MGPVSTPAEGHASDDLLAGWCTLDAPLVATDYPSEAGDTLFACHHCLPWYLEVLPDGLLREWHAVGCPALR